MKPIGIFIFIFGICVTELYSRKCENCTPLMFCEPIRSMALRISSTRSSKIINTGFEFIRQLGCGFANKVPYVCCPNDEKYEYRILNGESLTSPHQQSKREIHTYHEPSRENPVSASFPIYKPYDGPMQIVEYSLFIDCGKHLIRNTEEEDHNAYNSEFPWLANVESITPSGEINYPCGGVLISNHYVLTAAHCASILTVKDSKIILGQFNGHFDSPPTAKYDLEKIIIHPNYIDFVQRKTMNESAHEYDIALLKLKEYVVFSNWIQSICLPSSPTTKNYYYVAGWSQSNVSGHIEFDRKMKSKVSVVDKLDCEQRSNMTINANEKICVGEMLLRELPCVGDAGGPLMGYETMVDKSTRMSLYGISSVDLYCDNNSYLTMNRPGIYTRIHDSLPWIRTIING